MSRSLQSDIRALERKAQDKVEAIRRALLEYNDTLDGDGDGVSALASRKEREMEGIVGEYIKVYKAILRVRKKMKN